MDGDVSHLETACKGGCGRLLGVLPDREAGMEDGRSQAALPPMDTWDGESGAHRDAHPRR